MVMGMRRKVGEGIPVCRCLGSGLAIKSHRWVVPVGMRGRIGHQKGLLIGHLP